MILNLKIAVSEGDESLIGKEKWDETYTQKFGFDFDFPALD